MLEKALCYSLVSPSLLVLLCPWDRVTSIGHSSSENSLFLMKTKKCTLKDLKHQTAVVLEYIKCCYSLLLFSLVHVHSALLLLQQKKITLALDPKDTK